MRQNVDQPNSAVVWYESEGFAPNTDQIRLNLSKSVHTTPLDQTDEQDSGVFPSQPCVVILEAVVLRRVFRNE